MQQKYSFKLMLKIRIRKLLRNEHFTSFRDIAVSWSSLKNILPLICTFINKNRNLLISIRLQKGMISLKYRYFTSISILYLQDTSYIIKSIWRRTYRKCLTFHSKDDNVSAVPVRLLQTPQCNNKAFHQV